ncbi:MAG: hypothetical protein U0572_04170 [Phycisphaerales bacterium]
MTEFIVRVADLAEAEGRLLRATTVRVAGGVALIVLASILFAAGAGLLLASLYVVVAHAGGAALGAATTGLVAVLLGGVVTWLGRRMAL